MKYSIYEICEIFARTWRYQAFENLLDLETESQICKKTPGVQEEQYCAQNTAMRHYWHNVNQFTLTTVNHNVLWSIW